MKTTILFLLLGAIGFIGCEQAPFYPEKLNDREWELVRYSQGFGTTSVIAGTTITLRFSKDSITGSAGCNDYFGNWAYRELDLIAFSGQIATTERFCEGKMKQEDLYLRILSGISTFVVNDSILELSGPDGMLFFKPKSTGQISAVPPTDILLGYYMAGDEVSVFRDCADTSVVYWLEDTTLSLDSLYLQKTKGEQYQPVLLEIEAAKLPRLDLGYASEYDGLIRVVKIRRMALPDEKDGCYQLFTWG